MVSHNACVLLWTRTLCTTTDETTMGQPCGLSTERVGSMQDVALKVENGAAWWLSPLSTFVPRGVW